MYSYPTINSKLSAWSFFATDQQLPRVDAIERIFLSIFNYIPPYHKEPTSFFLGIGRNRNLVGCKIAWSMTCMHPYNNPTSYVQICWFTYIYILMFSDVITCTWWHIRICTSCNRRSTILLEPIKCMQSLYYGEFSRYS